MGTLDRMQSPFRAAYYSQVKRYFIQPDYTDRIIGPEVPMESKRINEDILNGWRMSSQLVVIHIAISQ